MRFDYIWTIFMSSQACKNGILPVPSFYIFSRREIQDLNWFVSKLSWPPTDS